MDIVSANMVLEHLEDPLSVFREIERVLAPGGSFIFVTPNRRHPIVGMLAVLLSPRARRLFARVAESKRDADRIFPTYYRANTRPALTGIGNALGLIPERVEVFSSLPMIKSFVPGLLVEAIWLWATQLPGFRECGSNIVGVMRKRAIGA